MSEVVTAVGIQRSQRICIALPTFLGQPPSLVQLELLLIPRARDGGVAPCPRKCNLHGFLKELKALDLLDGLKSRLWLLKDDERLALSLQVCLDDDVDDIAILREHGGQGFLERLGLDTLFEVAHVNTVFYLVISLVGDRPGTKPGTVCVGVQ